MKRYLLLAALLAGCTAPRMEIEDFSIKRVGRTVTPAMTASEPGVGKYTRLTCPICGAALAVAWFDWDPEVPGKEPYYIWCPLPEPTGCRYWTFIDEFPVRRLGYFLGEPPEEE